MRAVLKFVGEARTVEEEGERECCFLMENMSPRSNVTCAVAKGAALLKDTLSHMYMFQGKQ